MSQIKDTYIGLSHNIRILPNNTTSPTDYNFPLKIQKQNKETSMDPRHGGYKLGL